MHNYLDTSPSPEVSLSERSTSSPHSPSDNPGYPSYSEYKQIESSYMAAMCSNKKEKALISQALFDRIWDVLQEPQSPNEDGQFRFWARKQFTLSEARHTVSAYLDNEKSDKAVILHRGRPVAIQEQLYDVLCYCHGRASHGGRDKTFAVVHELFSWVPKYLVVRFVAACPTCIQWAASLELSKSEKMHVRKQENLTHEGGRALTPSRSETLGPEDALTWIVMEGPSITQKNRLPRPNPKLWTYNAEPTSAVNSKVVAAPEPPSRQKRTSTLGKRTPHPCPVSREASSKRVRTGAREDKPSMPSIMPLIELQSGWASGSIKADAEGNLKLAPIMDAARIHEGPAVESNLDEKSNLPPSLRRHQLSGPFRDANIDPVLLQQENSLLNVARISQKKTLGTPSYLPRRASGISLRSIDVNIPNRSASSAKQRPPCPSLPISLCSSQTTPHY